ncbi:MAG: hypothetical protein WC373_16630 [Smithella sp.]|jgi:hypothetical protein
MKTKAKNILLIGIILSGLFSISFVSAQTSLSDSPNIDADFLNAKIDLLENINNKILYSVYWTLATFASIFLGLMALNIFWNLSINKDKIKNIKNELENLINYNSNELEKKSENLSSISLEKNKKQLEDFKKDILLQTEKQKDLFNAESSRSMAFHCRSMSTYDYAFMWSMKSAFHFEKMDELTLPLDFLDFAEDDLINARVNHFSAKFFDDNLDDIRYELDFLKIKHETSIARIEKLLNEKLEQAKQVKPLPMKI